MISDKIIEELRTAIYKQFPELNAMRQRRTIKCLDLTLRREYAEQIAAGTKTVEYRWPIPFWNSKLENPEIDAFLDKNADSLIGLIKKHIPDIDADTASDNTIAKILPLVNRVETIHFHNYNPNGWRLTVECTYNNFCTPDNEGREWLHTFGSYEQDAEFDEWERNGPPIEEREGYYFFAIGRILSAKGLKMNADNTRGVSKQSDN
ncbi:MAG: ASCH domain-containing protein [Salinivirgaceae bacterium]|nr:ASCH domain-containing protein [Salinivirgaceae bacterium]